MALDKATADFLDQAAAAGPTPLHLMSVGEAREITGQIAELVGPGPELAKVYDVDLPGGAGAIPGRVLIPVEKPRGVIVYIHGGGWLMGTIDDFDALGRLIALGTGCAVVMVDYRLAPENGFPGPVEDCFGALGWAAEQLEEIAGAKVPLIVAGDSSGGNLAAAVALRARAAGGPEISLQILIYPVTAADFETGSYLDPDNQLSLDRRGMEWFWDHYAPDDEQRRDPSASPLAADDLSGLPPAVVLLAEHDVLRDEGAAYAARLRAAGVDVRERLFAGQMHGFLALVGILPGSADGLRYIESEVDRHLAGVGDPA